jgi:protoporphyrinogen oxidase
MRDVVVIGGGLSGLTAAYALEQAGVDYTLIEVKRRLGGSIRTEARDGWRIDHDAFMLHDTFDEAWLDALGLGDALTNEGDHVIFKQGTGALVDALAERIHAPRLMRMAVSSVGSLDDMDKGRWGICMENGLLLDAKALILAVPARYASRMLYSLDENIALTLADFHYDTIQRIALGLPADVLPHPIYAPPTMAYVYSHATTYHERVPDGQALVQVGMRIGTQEERANADAILDAITHDLRLPLRPTLLGMSYWTEADPLTCHDDTHYQQMQAIQAQLPPTMALIGSDYGADSPHREGIHDLGERITRAQKAVERLMNIIS